MPIPMIKKVGEKGSRGYVVTLPTDESVIACHCGKTHKVEVPISRRQVGHKARFRAPCHRKISVHWVKPATPPLHKPVPPPRLRPEAKPHYNDDDYRYPVSRSPHGGWRRCY